MVMRLDNDRLRITKYEKMIKIREYKTETLTLENSFYPLNAYRLDYKIDIQAHTAEDNLYFENVLQSAFYTKEPIEFLIPQRYLNDPIQPFDEDDISISSVAGSSAALGAGSTQGFIRNTSPQSISRRRHPEDLFTIGRSFQLTYRRDGQLIDPTIYTSAGTTDTDRSGRAVQVNFFPTLKSTTDVGIDSGGARNGLTGYEIYYTGVIVKYKQERRPNQKRTATFSISCEGVV